MRLTPDPQWYRSAFDEDYLERYQHRSPLEAKLFINTLKNNLFQNSLSGKRVLDVACGAGRHSLACAQEGAYVEAFDLSKAMIAAAKAKKVDPTWPPVSWNVSDMRSPWPDGPFNLILNLFTSCGYFPSDEESEGVIKKAQQHLTTDGFFVLDFLNAMEVKRSLQKISQKTVGEKTFYEQRWIADGRVNKETRRAQGSEPIATESVRLLEPSDIRMMLKKSGLTEVAAWGSYSGESFHKESKRFIIVSKIS